MKHDLGLFLVRATLGGAIAAHGAQKAFGKFEGPGPQNAAVFMKSLGFIDGDMAAKAAYYSELAAGGLIALGLFGPVGPMLLMSTMAVAVATVHGKNGFFAQKNGVELNVIYSAAALALASSGYGRISLDAILGLDRAFKPSLTPLAVLGAAIGALGALSQRVPPEPPPEAQASST